MVRVGVVGCGRIASRHLAAYKKIGVEVAVFDVDPEIASAHANEHGIAWVPSLQHFLDDPTIVAIDVCVPTIYHKDVVVAGLQHGKHVFCEKPLAATHAEALEIEAAQRDAGRIVMVGYLYRFYPAFQFVRELLLDGVIGAPYFSLFRLGGRGSAAAWKHSGAAGGGAILEMLVHKLDLAQWLFGPVAELNMLWKDTLLRERTVGDELVAADAEDCVAVSFRAGDVRVLCEADLITPSYMNHIDVQGDNGSIFSSMLHYLPTIVFCKEARSIYTPGNNDFSFPVVNVFERELSHFVDTISERADAINGVHESIELMRLVDAARTAPFTSPPIVAGRG